MNGALVTELCLIYHQGRLRHQDEFNVHELLIRRNPVFAALHSDRRDFYQLWIQEDINQNTIADILKLASERDVAIKKVSKRLISNKAQDNSHQGVLLEAGPYNYASVEEMIGLAEVRKEKLFLLVLDLLHGPQNIGSLLRTAEICGVHGVILQDRRAPDITPSVVQYSAGAAEYLLISQVTNLAQNINYLKELGVWVVGLDIDEGAMSFGDIDLDLSIAVVVGHEGSGLRRIIKKHCDFLLRLPMRGQTESLNAANAGSILLYAAWQARGFIGA
jgi:23S rRNA (guanosine2251-2'-O)-methyltransferase